MRLIFWVVIACMAMTTQPSKPPKMTAFGPLKKSSDNEIIGMDDDVVHEPAYGRRGSYRATPKRTQALLRIVARCLWHCV